jgi:hypothetical protein
MITTSEKAQALIMLTAMLSDETVPEEAKTVIEGWYEANDMSVALSIAYHEELVETLTEKGEQVIDNGFTAWCQGMEMTEDEFLSYINKE